MSVTNFFSFDIGTVLFEVDRIRDRLADPSCGVIVSLSLLGALSRWKKRGTGRLSRNSRIVIGLLEDFAADGRLIGDTVTDQTGVLDWANDNRGGQMVHVRDSLLLTLELFHRRGVNLEVIYSEIDFGNELRARGIPCMAVGATYPRRVVDGRFPAFNGSLESRASIRHDVGGNLQMERLLAGVAAIHIHDTNAIMQVNENCSCIYIFQVYIYFFSYLFSFAAKIPNCYGGRTLKDPGLAWPTESGPFVAGCCDGRAAETS